MDFKKLANENHEEVTRYTTRSFSRHGVSKGLLREKRIRNRAAKREVERIDLKERLAEANDVDPSPPEPDLELHWASPFDDEDELPLPDDYEECGDCGYDHSYEPAEATVAHGAGY